MTTREERIAHLKRIYSGEVTRDEMLAEVESCRPGKTDLKILAARHLEKLRDFTYNYSLKGPDDRAVAIQAEVVEMSREQAEKMVELFHKSFNLFFGMKEAGFDKVTVPEQ